MHGFCSPFPRHLRPEVSAHLCTQKLFNLVHNLLETHFGGQVFDEGDAGGCEPELEGVGGVWGEQMGIVNARWGDARGRCTKSTMRGGSGKIILSRGNINAENLWTRGIAPNLGP